MRKAVACCRVAASMLSLAGALSSTLAQAQTAEPQDAAASFSAEEIIVTAERRSQSVQKAPLAISVRDNAALLSEGRTTSLQRLLQDLPSVDWKENTGTVARNDTAATSITIRGIGSNGAVVGNVVSLVPAAALYVDEVLNGLGGNYDLERVEVLRGPQGTLYGRSATSGVIAVHTAQPELGRFAGAGGSEIGNYGLARVTGAVNVPLGDILAVRVAGQHSEQDGYYSPRGGRIEVDDGRAKLLFRPVPALTIQAGAAFQTRNFHSGGPTPQVTPAGLDFSQIAPVGNGRDHQQQYWAQIDLDLGFATLTYVPSLRYYRKSEVQYGFFGTGIVTGINSIDRDRFMTHEVRVASNGGSPLNWQAGLFYYDNDIAASFDQGTVLAGRNAKLHLGGLTKKTYNIGPFAEATYSMTDSTRITGGLRYDYTRVALNETDCSSLTSPTLRCATVNGANGVQKWKNLTFKARIEHDVSPANLLYASASSAFLPGDISIVSSTGGTLAPATYDSQTLTAYELGSKNRFFDSRLTLNAAAYYYIYGGYQQPIEIGTVGAVTLSQVGNSKARVKGAELEASFRPSPVDMFNLSLNYTNAYFVDKTALFAKSVAQHKIPRVTPFQANVGYSRTVLSDRLGSLRLKPEVVFYAAHDVAVLTAAQAANATIAAMARQGHVAVANFYVTWDAPQGVSISGYVRNIADRRYLTRVDTSGVTTRLNAELGSPRTIGILASVKF